MPKRQASPARTTSPAEPTRTLVVVAVTAALVAGFLGACGKVPPPDQLVVDRKAEQRKNLCLAWRYGAPRQTLTEAARGGLEQRALAELLLPAWTEDDPDELKTAFGALHEAAARLRRGEAADAVLAASEPSLVTTDQYFAAHCPAIIATEQSTSTGG